MSEPLRFDEALMAVRLQFGDVVNPVPSHPRVAGSYAAGASITGEAQTSIQREKP